MKIQSKNVISHHIHPTREEAEEAVRTLIRWAGDNPNREGLQETPRRVVSAFEEFFEGYRIDPVKVLSKTFEEVKGYDEMVILRDITFESHCEHHISPIIGRVHIAYLPDRRVIGISKLARIVEVFAHRLQVQEKLTAEIAHAINDVLKPKGVAVVVEATHHCMSTRGVHQKGVTMVTSQMLGKLKDDPAVRKEFLALLGQTVNVSRNLNDSIS